MRVVRQSSPSNDSLWNIAESAGFEVIVEDRNAANKEKKIDTGIVTEIMADAFEVATKGEDTITLVAGDGDFVPPVKTLTSRGYVVDVVFWGQAPSALAFAAGSSHARVSGKRAVVL